MYGTAKYLYLIYLSSKKEGRGPRKTILSLFKDVTIRLGKEDVRIKMGYMSFDFTLSYGTPYYS